MEKEVIEKEEFEELVGVKPKIKSNPKPKIKTATKKISKPKSNF
jgi:hypothetical protein